MIKNQGNVMIALLKKVRTPSESIGTVHSNKVAVFTFGASKLKIFVTVTYLDFSSSLL